MIKLDDWYEDINETRLRSSSPLPVIKKLQELCAERGYAFFDSNKPLNLNIFLWRLSAKPDKFNDEVWFVYRKEETFEWVIKVMTGTTKPGLIYLNKPFNEDGCAIVKGGQYRNSWVLGKHKGKTALVQAKDIKVYRDSDLDDQYNFTNPQVAKPDCKINFHRMCNANVAMFVNSWSAGCSGLNVPSDWVYAIDVISRSANIYGEYFTLTFLDTIRNE